MGQDADALLKIPVLEIPKKLVRSARAIADGVIYSDGNRCAQYTPDQHAWVLRQSLGEVFELHDDPRGVLLFSDVSEPRSDTYDEIVREMDEAGDAIWGVAARCEVLAQEALHEGGIDIDWLRSRVSASGQFTTEARAAFDEIAAELARALGGEDGWRWCLETVALELSRGRPRRTLPGGVSAVPGRQRYGWGGPADPHDESLIRRRKKKRLGA